VAAPGRAARFGLGAVLVAALFTLFLGFAHKSFCLRGDFGERAYGPSYCYTDLVPLYRSERLSEGRIPYLEADNEYPVGTGLFMWATSLPGRGEGDFFLTNALALSVLGLLIAGLLFSIAGDRAFMFALAPTLALSAFINWDLLAVAMTVGAVAAFLKRRDRAAGALLGLGAATKAFPALLIVPLVIDRLRSGERRGAARVAGWAAGAWVVANLPIALLAPERWSLFFRFSSERGPTGGTLWYALCGGQAPGGACLQPAAINALSLVAFLAGAVLIWRLTRARRPDFPRWTFGLPIFALFLLTNKVYSPQYSLWLLPWFVLAGIDLRLWVFFEVADAAVFYAEFTLIGNQIAGRSPSIVLLAFAVLLRSAALVAVLFGFVRGSRPGADAISSAAPAPSTA
jgi:uncharacterized membrane protein